MLQTLLFFSLPLSFFFILHRSLTPTRYFFFSTAEQRNRIFLVIGLIAFVLLVPYLLSNYLQRRSRRNW